MEWEETRVAPPAPHRATEPAPAAPELLSTEHYIERAQHQQRELARRLQEAIEMGDMARAKHMQECMELTEKSIASLRASLATGAQKKGQEPTTSSSNSLEQAQKRLGDFLEEDRKNPEAYWLRLVNMTKVYKLSVPQARDLLLMSVSGTAPDDQHWVNELQERSFATMGELEVCFMEYFRSHTWRDSRLKDFIVLQLEGGETDKAVGHRLLLAMRSLNINPADEDSSTLTLKEVCCNKARNIFSPGVQAQIRARESQTPLQSHPKRIPSWRGMPGWSKMHREP